MDPAPTTETPHSHDIFGMTDLHEALQGEDRDHVRRSIVSRLDSLTSAVAVKLTEGVPHGQLERAQSIHNALVRAQGLMLKITATNI